jgi:MinD-like ATPase involved in chromosome partitioning or flagellar assembly
MADNAAVDSLKKLKLPGLPVILTTSTKGGSGKTCTAQGMLIAAKLAGFSVCALDLDPIGSLYKWKTRRKLTQAIARGKQQFGRVPTDEELAELVAEPDPPDEITVSPTQPHALVDSLKILKAAGKNFAVIDTAGSHQNFADQAAKVSDLVLIASKPITKELEHLPGTLNQLAIAGDPPRFCVFNRVHPLKTTGLEQPRRICREIYNTIPLPLHFTDRCPVWEAADDMGLGPQELDPSGPAATEANNIFRFICEFLNLGRSEHANTIDEHTGTPTKTGGGEQQTATPARSAAGTSDSASIERQL